MNDDFNEKLPRAKSKRIQAFTWQRAGTNGHYTDIPGRQGEQIWCIVHPLKPGLAGWQICDVSGNDIYAEGTIEVTDVLDMRNQAEKIAMLWAGDQRKESLS